MKNMYKYLAKRYIKPLLLIAVFGLFAIETQAQQELLTTQWAYNKLTVNPAYAGGKDMFSVRALHRQQWVGIDGRPITTVLNAHSPFLRDRIAMGISYMHDKLGVMNSNTLALSYAYRLPFERNDSKLAFGVNFGFEALKINAGGLQLNDNFDPIKEQNYSSINLKTGAGVYYYAPKFYVGVSTPNVIPNRFYKTSDDFLNDDESKQAIHLYLMGGYAFEIADKKVVLKPQVLFKTVLSGQKKAPWQMDWNISMILYERLILGSTVRTTIGNKNENNLEDVASADLMIGVYATKQFLIGYAYDFTIGHLSNYDSGSHEIMLGFDMNFKRAGSYTPRYF
ncbi:MAG: type IX secretion system membrane protein PorP/SprF [Chitinophagales bacterium]